MTPQGAALRRTPLSPGVIPDEPVKSTQPFDHVWWWRKWRGDRKGQRCRVLARGNGGGPRNVLVEFEDGERVVAPRYAMRRVKER